MAPQDGDYSDGLAKGNTILLLISEIFGGVNGTSLHFLTRLAHKFKGCKAHNLLQPGRARGL